MKSKPFLITIGIVLILVSSYFLFSKGKTAGISNQPNTAWFLSRFNEQLIAGDTQSLLSFFEAKQQDNKDIIILLDIITGKKSFNDRPALFKPKLHFDESEIEVSDDETITATIPVSFSYKNLGTRKSQIIFTLKKNTGNQFVITSATIAEFASDYIAYENYINSKTVKETDIFSQQTLQAFETAESIKLKYDTVLWFSYVNDRTYLYVANGEWNMWKFFEQQPDSQPTAKMGMVDYRLKEIIPAQYDLVYGISGTFSNLIEVEKNSKHGFYNTEGELVIPVEYDQVYPVNKTDTLAALQKGDKFFWLTAGYRITPPVQVQLADIILQVPNLAKVNIDSSSPKYFTEINSRDVHESVYIPPSYMVSLSIFSNKVMFLTNPLRKNVYYEGTEKYTVSSKDMPPVETGDNIFLATFYSIRDYFLGGRAEFYDRKNLVLIDKKKNRVLNYIIHTNFIDGDYGGPTICKDYLLRPLNDTLFEINVSSSVYIDIPGNKTHLSEAPVFHYLYIKDNKLYEKESKRLFSFTKFVKMDDSYITGCYAYTDSTGNKTNDNKLKPAYLQYLKNEIYADYNYKFKSEFWAENFEYNMYGYKGEKDNVEAELTEIDRYNINWINQKLKSLDNNSLAVN